MLASAPRLVAFGSVRVGLVFALFTACVAPNRQDEVRDVLPAGSIKAPGAKGADKATGEPGLTEGAAPDKSVPPTDEQLAFIRRNGPANAPFTEGDRTFLSQLPSSPAPGSVTEAALALGLIKTVLHPLNVSPTTFREGDLGKDASKDSGIQNKLLSLEQLCRDHGLNLPDAVSENPLLGSAAVAQQTMAALTLGQNSSEFNTEITLALRKRASEWNQVTGAMPAVKGPAGSEPDMGPPAVAGPPSPPPSQAATATNDVAMLVPLAAAQPGGDNSLTEAQALADRGDFQAAIQHAASIPESSALRPQAQEKIKEFSNLGVQDLRKKAAAAFQTAMPVNDPKTKSEYLKQAKAYLEEAIKNFPEATQLPTVRENLRIISKDLDRISG